MSIDLPTDANLKHAMHSKARRRRGQISDCAAAAYLGEYELRRTGSKGDWGIFLCGTSVRVGTVFKTANPFARALMNTMGWAARRKRTAAYPRLSGDGPILGKTESSPTAP